MATRAEQFRAQTQRSGAKKAPASSKGSKKAEVTDAEAVTALDAEEVESVEKPAAPASTASKSKRTAADLGKRAATGSPVVRAAQAKAKTKKTR